MEDRRRRETTVDMLAVTVVMSGFTELEHKTSMSDLNLIVLNVGRVSKEVGEGAPYKKYFCLQSAPFIWLSIPRGKNRDECRDKR